MKVRPGGENSSRGEFAFSVISGPKEDRYEYLKQPVKTLNQTNGRFYEFNFKVAHGREKLRYLFTGGLVGHEVVDVDDFELIAQ